MIVTNVVKDRTCTWCNYPLSGNSQPMVLKCLHHPDEDNPIIMCGHCVSSFFWSWSSQFKTGQQVFEDCYKNEGVTKIQAKTSKKRKRIRLISDDTKVPDDVPDEVFPGESMSIEELWSLNVFATDSQPRTKRRRIERASAGITKPSRNPDDSSDDSDFDPNKNRKPRKRKKPKPNPPQTRSRRRKTIVSKGKSKKK